MALSSNTTTTASGASAFLARLFAVRSGVSYTDKAEITDCEWEFVNNSDISDEDDDNIIDILSDSENENASTLVSVSFVDNHGLKIDDQDYGSVTAVGISSTYNELADEKKKANTEKEQAQEEYLDDEIEDPVYDHDKEYNDDLDDELVPWNVHDRLGRQRMRKLGSRGFSKKNKTTKKFAYTVNRPGCVRGKHGLGRKA